MTHAEFLRDGVAQYLKHQDGDVVDRVHTIADRLDAMQWRDKPPNSEGDWVQLVRNEKGYWMHVWHYDGDERSLDGWAGPGDRWLKLPERPK